MSEPKRDDEPTMEEILASIRKIISEDDPGKVQAAAGDGAADADDDLEAGATQGAESDDDAEPMELTQMVSEDGSVVDLRAESQAGPPAVEEPSASEERNAEEAAAEPAAEGPPAIVKPLVPEGTRVHAERESEDDGVPAPEPQEPEAAAREPEVEPEVEPEMEPGAEDQAGEPDAAAARAPRKPEPEGLVSAEATAAATAAMSRLKDRLAAGHMAVGGGGDKSLEALARETMAPHLKSWLDRNLPELVERIVREEIEKLVKQSEPR